MEKKGSIKKYVIIGIAVLCAAAVCIAVYFLSAKRESSEPTSSDAETSSSASETVSGETESASTSENVSIGTDKEVSEEENIESLPRELPENSILTSVKAEKQTGGCIEADTSFILSAKEDMSAESLAARLSFSPEVSFSLDRTAECTYTLKTDKPFPPESLIKLSLNGEAEYRWAFQTAVGEFKSESVFPADKSSGVSVSTGIEIEFNDIPDAKSAEGHFEITPKKKGRFEVHGKTLVFVPAVKLGNNSVYTVTLKKGMLSASGKALEEDISFLFKTEKEQSRSYCYASNGVSETFVKGDIPLIELYCSKDVEKKDFKVNLYKYNNTDEYFSVLKGYSDSISWDYDEYEFSYEGLDCVYSSEEKLMLNPNASSWASSYLLLPEELDYGCYLADVKAGGHHIQRLIQISDISVYASVLQTEAAFFVNDASDGTAAVGADIELYIKGDSYSGTTSADGTAVIGFEENEHKKGAFMIECGGKAYADVFDCASKWSENNPEEDYYMYLYTDREAYLTTDTIKVWGLIRPRGGRGAALPEDLGIALSYGYNWDNINNSAVPVKLYDDGTFTAEISFKDSVEHWAYVCLVSGDTLLDSKGLNIVDYVKPTYNITSEATDKVFMPHKNPFTVSVNAEYFDGTPAEGLQFEISGYDVHKADPKTVYTDEKGHAESVVSIKDEDTWVPQYTDVKFKLAGIENEYDENYSYSHFKSLFRDVMLEYETKDDDLYFTTSKVDFSKISSSEYYYGSSAAEKLRGEPVDTTVTAVLTRSWYTREENGEYYDFLLKKTFKKYKYTSHEETVGTFTADSVNGKGVFKDLPVNDENSRYEVTLTWKDTYGQTVKDYAYIYNDKYYSGYNNATDYHYFTFAHESEFKENEAVGFTLMDNYDEVTAQGGRVFCAFNQNEFIDNFVADGTSFSHVITNDYVPNVYISGAYFDGRHVFTVHDSSDWGYVGLDFDPGDRKLTLDVVSDKESYSPADTAEITVGVTDVNGTAVSGAAVLLSTVDEAAFAVAKQTANPLGSIYRLVYTYPYPVSHCSYIQHSLNGYSGGEKGGGGDDGPYIRNDFKDTAAFLTGVTDENGKAVFTVKLPDNITSWRATVQAVISDSRGELFAGTEKIGLPSSLSFFLTPIMLPKYTEGDDICLSCKTAGAESGVDIDITVTGNGTEKTITVPEGRAANFGKLPKGEYKALFAAKSEAAEGGIESDAVELSFEVVETQLETSVSKSFELNGGMPEIDPLRWPVKMSFYDGEYLFYGDVLCKLSRCYGDRLDFEIARSFAYMEFGFITEEEFIERHGGIDGLVSLMSYSENDTELTALICAAAPQLVSDNTSKAFYRIIEDEESSAKKVSSAYMGLAALSEPVLHDVLSLLESPPTGFGDKDKLRLCAALALLGDYENALKYYTEFTDEDILIYKSEYDDNTVYARVKDFDTTRLSLITASLLGLPEADGMARYLTESKQREVSTAPELMIYLENYKSEHEGSAVLKYNIDGEERTVTLDRFGRCTLKFSEEQFKNANFKAVSGKVLCTAYYEGRFTELESEPKKLIEKKLTPVSGGWQPGALVKVTLTMSHGERNRAIDDVVPSGARFAGTANIGYARRSGQRVSGYVNNYGQMSYYIRLAAPGEYVLESAVSVDSDGNCYISERTTLTVEEYEQNV